MSWGQWCGNGCTPSVALRNLLRRYTRNGSGSRLRLRTSVTRHGGPAKCNVLLVGSCCSFPPHIVRFENGRGGCRFENGRRGCRFENGRRGCRGWNRSWCRRWVLGWYRSPRTVRCNVAHLVLVLVSHWCSGSWHIGFQRTAGCIRVAAKRRPCWFFQLARLDRFLRLLRTSAEGIVNIIRILQGSRHGNLCSCLSSYTHAKIIEHSASRRRETWRGSEILGLGLNCKSN